MTGFCKLSAFGFVTLGDAQFLLPGDHSQIGIQLDRWHLNTGQQFLRDLSEDQGRDTQPSINDLANSEGKSFSAVSST